MMVLSSCRHRLRVAKKPRLNFAVANEVGGKPGVDMNGVVDPLVDGSGL